MMMATCGGRYYFPRAAERPQALRGAAAAIRSHRLAFAICVYHRPDDLLVIPELIEELAGSGVYRYYLRLHDESFLLNELVLYAIPA